VTARTATREFHAVKFYKDAATLAEIVCAFLVDGLTAAEPEPAVIIATADHARTFRECLVAKGLDLETLRSRAELTWLDADETLGEFMRNGVPVRQRFVDTMTPILTAIAARFPGRTIRAYGEMVDVLWKREETAAAIALENLWNDLARSHRFSLLCGYAMGHFYKGSSTDEICGVHTHVVTETGASVQLS
jgi:hypothetical protein